MTVSPCLSMTGSQTMYSAALRVNERHDHEETVRKLDQLFSEASSSLDSETNKLVSQVIGYSKEISSFAHEYDFEDVHANGFRILLALTGKILRRGLSVQNRGNKFRDQFTSLLQSMVSTIPYLKKLREKTKSSGIPIAADKEFFVEVMQRYVKSDFEAHEPFYDAFAGVAFGITGKILITIRDVAVLLFYGDIKTLLRSLFDKKLRLRTLDKRLRSFDLMALKFVDKLFFNSFAKAVSKLIVSATNLPIGLPPWPQSILVPRQKKYMVVVDPNNNPVFGVEKDYGQFRWGSDEVRCLYSLKSQKAEAGKTPPDAVILDAHGGGFVSGCPEMHLTYCQRWAQRMPGVGVLQVRYTLCPDARFPVQIQQMLDVYLWLVSGDESVKDKIGFHPKKIVLAGDSAGALFVTSMLVVLNEIRKKLNPELRLPVAVFSFYGAFSIIPLMSAAMFASPFHFFLLPNTMMGASRCYRPDLENLDAEPIRSFSFHEIYRLLNQPQANIFGKDVDSVMQYLQKLDGITDHPFLSPMFYDDFDSLSDVELHCTSTHSEPILDSTIAMLKKWKGKASLTMMGNLVHGHLNSVAFSRQHNQAFEQTVDRFRSVLQINGADQSSSSGSILQMISAALSVLLLLCVTGFLTIKGTYQ